MTAPKCSGCGACASVISWTAGGVGYTACGACGLVVRHYEHDSDIIQRARRALSSAGYCGDGNLAEMITRALQEAAERGRQSADRSAQEVIEEVEAEVLPESIGTLAQRVRITIDHARHAARREEQAAMRQAVRRDLGTVQAALTRVVKWYGGDLPVEGSPDA